jgi:DNA replication protein DnaC
LDRELSRHLTVHAGIFNVDPRQLNQQQLLGYQYAKYVFYRLFNNIPLEESEVGLIIIGTAGTGKTFLVRCIQRYAQLLSGVELVTVLLFLQFCQFIKNKNLF